MPATARFALFQSFAGHVKPTVFADADQLARRIQRDRGLAALDLVEIEEEAHPDHPHATRFVQVWTLDGGNSRDRFLGYAWLDNHGLETLKAALRRNFIVRADEDAEAA